MFSRYGIIAEEIDRSTPRIKLYTNPDGSFKGDALLVYFRAESVDLAIQMLDDSEFRLGAGQGNMRVTKASFEFKKVKGDEEQSKEDKPAAGPKKRNDPGERDKKKIIQKTQKLNRYAPLACEWDTYCLHRRALTLPSTVSLPTGLRMKTTSSSPPQTTATTQPRRS